ncbi:alpha/beta fold hydrolase [Amycolatopsis rhizosphaerae]|uniref:Alpha/beta fold hydrolase n=1 Tax=Amycolatopsis rhizosphaerae TaxID=2053003 RepID=A0A558C0J6_9PSEU|nr:alpha/beta fold hydrolase [Amycolatopsis rhizosphaerae]TVT42289.1 alpha/beta fold hydrolase [Amycolatopsis rhizosphaerae]
MTTFTHQGFTQYYEVLGDRANPPVLLISGLGGVAKSWGQQIERFAESYFVLLPDQRGTGRTTHAIDGYTTGQLARDMVSVVEHAGLRSVHIVGASTGGAIAQHIALGHPDVVRSLTLSSSFARFDPFMRREFGIRRKMAAEWDRFDLLSAYSLFLFSPRFTYDHPERVSEWIEIAGAVRGDQTGDREIDLKRIDMIAAHDTSARLGEIVQPTLVLCGDNNHCTPMPVSEELAKGIPGAELVVFTDAGELIEIEKPDHYFAVVSSFIERHL